MNPLDELLYRGKSLEEGKALATKQGFHTVRVIDKNDPVENAYTLEADPGRITLTIQDGKIIEATGYL